jgi:hypothetical protein
MTETAAVFKDARIWVSFSGENLQFLYCVLPSYNGFFEVEAIWAAASDISAGMVDIVSGKHNDLVGQKRNFKKSQIQASDHRCGCARCLAMNGYAQIFIL